MHVLVLQHAPAEGPGTLGTFLESRGVDLATCRVHDDEPVPEDPGDASAVLVLGGPQSVAGGKEPHFFAPEAALIDRALRREIPVLGVCLGAQILARVCGARVTRAPYPEIGWSRVKLTPEGRQDPLFLGVDAACDVFQWHEDAFEVPPQGTLLAEGDFCRNQAFRWGRCAYGLLFHVEVTPEMIREWRGSQPDALTWPALRHLPATLERTARMIYLNFLGDILHLQPVPCPPALGGGA